MRTNRRPAIIIKHRHAREIEPHASERKESTMESYRNAIIKMLDQITEVNLMKMIYEVIHAILRNR